MKETESKTTQGRNRKGSGLLRLLAAGVVGFLLGWLTNNADGVQTQRAGRPFVSPSAGEQDEPIVRAKDDPPALATDVLEADTRGRSESLVAPTDVLEEADGATGQLEVRAGGIEQVHQVRVISRAMEGSPLVFEAKVSGYQSRSWTLGAGTYPVYWFGRDGVRYGVQARVEAGRRTSVNIADQGTDAEIGTVPGLGTLDVTVTVPAGAPSSKIGVEVEGTADSATRYTNSSGRCRFYLVPARYVVSVGPRRLPVVLRAGEAVAMTVAHDVEGAVLFDHDQAHLYKLLLAGRAGAFLDVEISKGTDTSAILFVPPGVHSVVQKSGRGRLPVGSVTVHSRRITRFDHSVPAGGVRVYVARLHDTSPIFQSKQSRRLWRFPDFAVTTHLRVEDASVDLRAAMRRGRPKGHFGDKTDVWIGEIENLPVGVYEIRISAEGFTQELRRVDVGDGTVELYVEVRWSGAS